MNILFVSSGPFFPEIGGIERVTDRLCRNFLAHGYRCFYLTFPYRIDSKNFQYPVTSHFFPEINCHSQVNREFYHDYLRKNHIDIVINQHGDNAAHSKLFLDIGEYAVKRISVLHCDPLQGYDCLWKSILSSKEHTVLEAIKQVVRILLYMRRRRNIWKSVHQHFDFLNSHTDCVVTFSPNYKKTLSRINSDLARKIVSIPNPNTYDSVKEIPVHKEREVLFVGRLAPGKRVERILKIWSMLWKNNPNWRLSIIGEGSVERWLKKMAKKMALQHITFYGRQDPLPFYQRASIVCLTSDNETWGMALTEGMQMACVPMTFNYVATEDFIKSGENGEVIPPYKLDIYAHKLQYLMQNDKYRMELAKNAFDSIKKFDLDSVAAQWHRLLQVNINVHK